MLRSMENNPALRRQLGERDWTGCSASGSATVKIRGTINCTLDGKQGVVVMRSEGRRAAGAAEWQGQWVIVSATGALANMHGQGTWWGPGFNPANPGASPDVYYSGQILFAPD